MLGIANSGQQLEAMIGDIRFEATQENILESNFRSRRQSLDRRCFRYSLNEKRTEG